MLAAMRGSTGNVARLFTGAETRSIDRRAIREFAIPGIRLMHRAGRAAFEALRSRWPQARRLCVVCGSGNNAGDGYVIAGLAKDAGLAVQVIPVGDPAKLEGDARQAYRFAACRLGALEQADPEWRIDADVVVDALLGTGARGAARSPYRDAIARVNASGRPVLSIDVPSGVDADRGALLMDEAVRAAATITFVAPKLGLHTGPAVDYAGEVLFDGLEVPTAAYADAGLRVASGDALGRLTRLPGAHKGDFGRLLIVGGEADMGGAVLLAGEAALRAGAGLVSVATRSINRAPVVARRPELMALAAETPADLADALARCGAVAVGPGLGRGAWGRGLLEACAAAGKPLVVDADGLRAAADADALSRLPAGAILTPHPGEAGHLLGKDAAWVQAHRPEAAARLSAHGAVAVLKGAGTLVAEGGELQSICLAGNPGLACAGSGDVLTGLVAALLAQGIEPLAAAELGVWLHARAGDEAAGRGNAALIASDVIAALRLAP